MCDFDAAEEDFLLDEMGGFGDEGEVERASAERDFSNVTARHRMRHCLKILVKTWAQPFVHGLGRTAWCCPRTVLLKKEKHQAGSQARTASGYEGSNLLLLRLLPLCVHHHLHSWS